MESKAGSGRRERLSPAVVTGIIAGAAGATIACGTLLLLYVRPALTAPFLIVSPVLVAMATWLAARHALRNALKPAMATMRGHAAVARLLGAGIGRLAQGDTDATITIVLPAPYEACGHDFNAAASTLQSARADAEQMRLSLASQATELDEAARRLANRAKKLAERIEADLRLITALEAHDRCEALKIACHTLQGASIAARRNIEAATQIGAMARPETEGTLKAGPAAKAQTDIAA